MGRRTTIQGQQGEPRGEAATPISTPYPTAMPKQIGSSGQPIARHLGDFPVKQKPAGSPSSCEPESDRHLITGNNSDAAIRSDPTGCSAQAHCNHEVGRTNLRAHSYARLAPQASRCEVGVDASHVTPISSLKILGQVPATKARRLRSIGPLKTLQCPFSVRAIQSEWLRHKIRCFPMMMPHASGYNPVHLVYETTRRRGLMPTCSGTARLHSLSRRSMLVLAGLATARPSSALAAPTLNVLFDGDSISAGAGVPRFESPYEQLARMLGPGAQVKSVAVGGRPVKTCNALYSQLVAPAYDPSAKLNVIAFHAGDNDIAQGSTAQQTYDQFTGYVRKAHAQGWKIIVTTELDRPRFSITKQNELAEYNTMLLQNRAAADIVYDYNQVPAMRDHRNPWVYTEDEVHPTVAGYTILAEMVLNGIKRLERG